MYATSSQEASANCVIENFRSFMNRCRTAEKVSSPACWSPPDGNDSSLPFLHFALCGSTANAPTFSCLPTP